MKNNYLNNIWRQRVQDMVGKYVIEFDAPERDTTPDGIRPIRFLQNPEYTKTKSGHTLLTGFPWMAKTFGNKYQAKHVCSCFKYNNPRVRTVTASIADEWLKQLS